jgi:hypothetical protein
MFGWARLIFMTGGCGFFIIATGSYQPHMARNWAGQYCTSPEGCVYPEWIMVGMALLIGAYVLYRSRDPWAL